MARKKTTTRQVTKNLDPVGCPGPGTGQRCHLVADASGNIAARCKKTVDQDTTPQQGFLVATTTATITAHTLLIGPVVES
jgi:hypothetical protein